ncbi:hypothetical protein C2S51_023112 [Perilla frutescens var. frutescens]|nr:hypothetical protein C2S51_023112 [Perilla frutescens var. frutescens]
MAKFIVFLISALCIFSVSADVFVSIDCGSSDSYTDENLIVWSGDDNLILNGESYTVQTSNSISPVIDTLRAFTTRKKNCYSIEATKGERVLLRATFYYGNYDQKSSPPTFDLHFDGNHWATVETSSTEYVYYETTYVLKADYVSVCVAQTKPGQFPFISALEARSLLPTMYDSLDQNYPLHLIRRVAYGARATVRYADDAYDRIWTTAAGGDGLTPVASEALLVDTSVRDEPPLAVVQNAVTAVIPTARIQLLMGFPSVGIPVYLNMYFSEVRELEAATEKRSFQVVMNNEALLEEPVIPPYRNTTEVICSNITVSSTTTFALVPSNASSLPPLINAMEVFQIGDLLTHGTNTQDVDGLASLQNGFDVLQDWSGDPCLPAPYSWDWIDCSTDPTPRVTALNLASNQFSGPIPDSLSKKNGLNLIVTDNPELCTSGKECKSSSSSSPTDINGGGLSSSPRRGGAKKKKSKTPVILGTTVPISVMIWAVVGALFALHHRRKAAAVAASSSGQEAKRPQSSPSMLGKMGEAMMNEIKINMETNQSSVELTADQQQDGTTTASTTN